MTWRADWSTWPRVKLWYEPDPAPGLGDQLNRAWTRMLYEPLFDLFLTRIPAMNEAKPCQCGWCKHDRALKQTIRDTLAEDAAQGTTELRDGLTGAKLEGVDPGLVDRLAKARAGQPVAVSQAEYDTVTQAKSAAEAGAGTLGTAFEGVDPAFVAGAALAAAANRANKRIYTPRPYREIDPNAPIDSVHFRGPRIEVEDDGEDRITREYFADGSIKSQSIGPSQAVGQVFRGPRQPAPDKPQVLRDAENGLTNFIDLGGVERPPPAAPARERFTIVVDDIAYSFPADALVEFKGGVMQVRVILGR